MRSFVMVMALSCAMRAQTAEQAKADDQCTVEGYVYGAHPGEVLRKAQVMLRSAGGRLETAYGASTDARGHFFFDEIDPGRYLVTAQKNGYVSGDSGQKTVTVEKGQQMKGINLRMTPQAVITGRVVDEDNEGVANVGIRLMQQTYSEGRKTLSGGGNYETDDRGVYRIFGIGPGRYYLVATNNADRGMLDREITDNGKPMGSYVPVYYPDSLGQLAGASPVTATAGAVIAGIDFHLKRVHTVRLSGVLKDAPVAASRPPAVMLLPRDEEGIGWEMGKAQPTDAQGGFVFHDVTPGSYTLHAQLPDQRSATTTVEVGESNIDGIVLTAGAQADVSGTVKAEGLDLKGAGLQVFLEPVPRQEMFGNLSAIVADNGSFKITAVAPGRYRVNVFPLPEKAYVRSVAVGGTEAPDGMVDFSHGAAGDIMVTLSGRGGEVAGTVRRKTAASPGATVVLVPDQRERYDLFKSATADQNGRFSINGVRPGGYKLFAWEQVESGAWTDAEYLQAFEKIGEVVVINEADKLQKDLKLIVADETAR